MSSLKYDYVVLGSGPAGHTSAIRAAQLGLKTIMIEANRDMLGGVCLNEGCIPAKSLYHSAYESALCAQMNRASGIAPFPVDPGKMVQKSQDAVRELAKGLDFVFKKNNVDIFYGTGKFIDKNTLSVNSPDGENEITGNAILIATGSSTKKIDGFITDGETIITSREAIRMLTVPESILIIGGGAIGVELASYFDLLGSDVTIIEAMPSLLPCADKEITRRLETIFKKSGINVLTGHTVVSLKTANGIVETILFDGTTNIPSTFSKAVICAGRTPNTSAICIGNTGIQLDPKGFIPVDPFMRTRVPSIFAAGDVVNSPLLAHVASYEGIIAAENAAGRKTRPAEYTAIPNAVYTKIKISSVGLTEESAKTKGIKFLVGRQFFKANGRAVAEGSSEGLVKIIAEDPSRKILGAHILGQHADEMIHEMALAMRNGLTTDQLMGTVHAHPTFSECIVGAAESMLASGASHG